MSVSLNKRNSKLEEKKEKTLDKAQKKELIKKTNRGRQAVDNNQYVAES